MSFKLGCWHDIGYWRLGLADDNEPPNDPIPFAHFREMSAFAAALRST